MNLLADMPLKTAETIEWITLNVANGALLVAISEMDVSMWIAGIVGLTLAAFNIVRIIKVVKDIKRQDKLDKEQE